MDADGSVAAHVTIEPVDATASAGETGGPDVPGDGPSAPGTDPATGEPVTDPSTNPTLKPAAATKTVTTTTVTNNTAVKTPGPRPPPRPPRHYPRPPTAIGLPCPACCSCWEQRFLKLRAVADAPDFRMCGKTGARRAQAKFC